MNKEYNPKDQYGDYLLISGHGLHDEDPVMVHAEIYRKEQIELTIPEEYLKTTKIKKIKDEAWMADSDEAGEYKGSLWPHKLAGVSMSPVTVVGWKTIPKKMEGI